MEGILRLLIIAILLLAGCQTQFQPNQTRIASNEGANTQWAGDNAIRRIENCICYASIEAQNLKPWEIAWNNPDKLRSQISRCMCNAEIDIPNVKDPRRYLVPGTVVK